MTDRRMSAGRVSDGHSFGAFLFEVLNLVGRAGCPLWACQGTTAPVAATALLSLLDEEHIDGFDDDSNLIALLEAKFVD